MTSIRVLGIDPGVARIGWGVLSHAKKTPIAEIWGRIDTKKEMELSERLQKIQNELENIIRKVKPQRIAVEKIFFAKNVKTAIAVSHARGVILVTAANAHIPVVEYTPLEIKQTLTGYGRAEKRQVQAMVKALLGVALTPSHDDIADALAVAYTGLVYKKIL